MVCCFFLFKNEKKKRKTVYRGEKKMRNKARWLEGKRALAFFL
jgi:hypothetical protein